MEILKSNQKDLGGGLIVSRVLPGHPQQMVGPLIFFDQMGPMTAAPGQNVDVRPHPHIGLATVTWLFEGQMIHRDSLGVVQPIAPGDINWMTSGRGIVHSERGGPEKRKPGVEMRLIAGDAFGEKSPAPTFSKMFYLAAEMDAGAVLVLPPEHEERGIYLVQGDILVDGTPLPERSLAFVSSGKGVEMQAKAQSRVLLLGGEKMDSPRHIWWNFVSSSKEKLEDAKQRWREQRFAPVPGETEFIPLPG